MNPGASAVSLEALLDPGQAVIGTEPGHFVVAHVSGPASEVGPVGREGPLFDGHRVDLVLLPGPDVGEQVDTLLGHAVDDDQTTALRPVLREQAVEPVPDGCWPVPGPASGDQDQPDVPLFRVGGDVLGLHGGSLLLHPHVRVKGSCGSMRP